jgi:hypothetical protein
MNSDADFPVPPRQSQPLGDLGVLAVQNSFFPAQVYLIATLSTAKTPQKIAHQLIISNFYLPNNKDLQSIFAPFSKILKNFTPANPRPGRNFQPHPIHNLKNRKTIF